MMSLQVQMVLLSCAGGVLIGLLLESHRALLLALLLAVPVAIYASNPICRTYSYHGMIHTGIVYQVMYHGLPPEDPYFAGVPLQYPWMYHSLVAALCYLLNITPAWVYAACNLTALAASVVLIAKIAKEVEGDEVTARCTVILALLGPTFVGKGTMDWGKTLTRTTKIEFWAPNALPLLDKFTNINVMPLGVALSAALILVLLRIIKGLSISWFAFVWVGLLVAVAGLFYPLLWLADGLVGTVCVSVAVLAGHRRKALGLAFALAAGSLVIAPYLHSLVAQKDPSQSIRISRDWGEWAPHFLHVVVVLVPLWFFIALRRRTLVEQLSRRSWVHWAVAGSALALLLAYIFLHVPGHAGYKYRAMAVLFLAVMAAPGLKSIYTYNRFVFVGIVSLLFFPLMFDSVHKLTRGGPVSELTLADGFVLRHADASEDALYQWISRHTTANAIIVDNKPYVPVFAHRPLFVARGGRGLEGWSTSTTFWLGEVHGHRRRAIEARNEIVDNLYSPTATPRDDTAWRLAELTGDRPVFIVARNEEQQAALEQKPFIRKAASTEDWAIFEFIK